MNKQELENLIKDCRTDKQVLKALNNAKVKYSDDTKDSIDFNLHIDNGMRIYKNMRKEYTVQNPMQKVKLEYSGIPVFFMTDSYF